MPTTAPVQRILVVEDDHAVAALVRAALEREGFQALQTSTLKVAKERLLSDRIDLVVLDRGLPDGDGLELCSWIRATGRDTLILMLTVSGALDDRVSAIDQGADAYVSKPFSIAEVVARIRSLTQRGPLATIRGGEITVDRARRRADRLGRPIDLTMRELGLLEVFVQHPDQVLTREQILAQVWDVSFGGSSNIVDVYVRRLRKKVDRPFGSHHIATVHGVGYRFLSDPQPV